MTDWAGDAEIRNYGIKSQIDGCMLSELLRTIITLSMVAGVLLFYLWVQNQIVTSGYESQNLFMEEGLLSRTHKRLVLEEEMLRNPGRIDIIARNNLGMAPLHPTQLMLPQRQTADIVSSETLAMANSEEMSLGSAAPVRTPATIPVH
jgi:cell division protein FtsL